MLLLFAPGCRETRITNEPPQATTGQATALEPAGGAALAPKTGLPRTDERSAERSDMVRTQIANRGVKNKAVLEAMKNVPRHWFVPEPHSSRAYEDRPLPIGYDQTISQPYIVAVMTESLGLKPGDKVLEIGTGSGYQAAVLAELTDKVYTIEIVEALARRTMKLLSEKGYNTIRTRVGDGYGGWPEEAPFDAIIVTCAPDQPPPALVAQLAAGGRMCIPVGGQTFGQELVLITKQADGSLKRENMAPVSFVPMTGESEKQGK